jgi:hypothetical protein
MSDVAELWKVINRKNRVIFEGIEKDARLFISDNFPRVHVEPGSPDPTTPDAKLRAPDGTDYVHTGPGDYVPLDEYDPGEKAPPLSDDELEAKIKAMQAEQQRRYEKANKGVNEQAPVSPAAPDSGGSPA